MLKIHFLFPLKISERVLPMVNPENVTVPHSPVHRGKCLARRVTEPKWDSATINLLNGHSIELTPDDFLLHQRPVHSTALIREASIVSRWWLRLPQPVNMQKREYSMLSPKWAIYIIPLPARFRDHGVADCKENVFWTWSLTLVDLTEVVTATTRPVRALARLNPTMERNYWKLLGKEESVPWACSPR